MARKKRTDATQARKRTHEPNGTFMADDPATPQNEAFGVEAPKPAIKIPATEGKQACKGPTTGYRDAADGKVERKTFNDGYLPGGWHDTPADCENCDGMSHPEYVEG